MRAKTLFFLFSLFLLGFSSTNIFAQAITIQSLKGEITLSKPAKRIVVLEFSLLDDLLQLGIKPIALASSRADEGTNPPFLMPQIAGIEEVGTRQQPNLEKIIALHPDLIVADITLQENIYPLLNNIAPTLMLNGLLGKVETQIDNLNKLAQATNTQDKVPALKETLIKQYEHAKQMAIKHPANVMIGYANIAGQFQALTANALTSQILDEFAHPNLMTISREEQSTFIPMETLLVKDPDSIIILLTDGDLNPYYTLIRQPLWKELRAVKTRHLYFMDRDIWAKNHGFQATLLLLKEAEQSGFLVNRPNLSIIKRG